MLWMEECAIHNGTVISALEHALKLFARQNCRPSLSLSFSLYRTHTHASIPHTLSLTLYLCMFVCCLILYFFRGFLSNLFSLISCFSSSICSCSISFYIIPNKWFFLSFFLFLPFSLPLVYLSVSDSLLIILPITQSQSRFCPSDFKGCHTGCSYFVKIALSYTTVLHNLSLSLPSPLSL